MHIFIIVVTMIAALWLSSALRKRFLSDPETEARFRRLYYVWSFRAAGIALVIGLVLALFLRSVAAHG